MINRCSGTLLTATLASIFLPSLSAFQLQPPHSLQSCFEQQTRSTFSHKATSNTLPEEFSAESLNLPPNEFSRKLSPDRILRSRSGRNSYSKDYTMDIEATPEECQALADRFDLANIAELKASLSLRREGGGSAASASTARSYTSQTGIQVEGTIRATVTQSCVRTGEKFEVGLEYPLDCRVRAVPPLWLDMPEEPTTKPKKTKNKSRSDFQQVDMMELQKMLENIDEKEEYDIMEDQAIYTINGMLDVGELVAQTFWLQLDPYPKKPGTEPFKASISG